MVGLPPGWRTIRPSWRKLTDPRGSVGLVPRDSDIFSTINIKSLYLAGATNLLPIARVVDHQAEGQTPLLHMI